MNLLKLNAVKKYLRQIWNLIMLCETTKEKVITIKNTDINLTGTRFTSLVRKKIIPKKWKIFKSCQRLYNLGVLDRRSAALAPREIPIYSSYK